MIEKVREMLEAIGDHLNSDDSDLEGLSQFVYDILPVLDEELESICNRVLEHLKDTGDDVDLDDAFDPEEL